MNDLKTELHRSLDRTLIDTARLAEEAVRRGSGIRRRNRALLGGAVAATAVATVGVGAALTGLPRPAAPEPPAATSSDAAPVALTGRATAAALRDLVAAHTDAPVSGFGGHDSSAARKPSTVGLVRVANAPAVPVRVDVDGEVPPEDALPRCQEIPDVTECRTGRRGDWQVVTFASRAGEAIHRQVSAYDAGRRLLVRARTTNARELTLFTFRDVDAWMDTYVSELRSLPEVLEVTRERLAERTEELRERLGPVADEPPLSLASLEEIATWSGWGATIDAAYEEKGTALAGYQEVERLPAGVSPLLEGD